MLGVGHIRIEEMCITIGRPPREVFHDSRKMGAVTESECLEVPVVYQGRPLVLEEEARVNWERGSNHGTH